MITLVQLIIRKGEKMGNNELEVIRHSASHVLAQAVKRLYPQVKLAIGPSTEDGFYYDIDRDTSFSEEELVAIEAEMKKVIKENLPIKRKELSRAEALKYFWDKGEIYKVELISELPENEIISVYEQGEFTDLCLAGTSPARSTTRACAHRRACCGSVWPI